MNNDALKFTKETFSKGGPLTFWHHLSAYVDNKNIYQNPAIEERIQQISKRLINEGGNSFNRLSHGNMTPLHVATINENVAAVDFLIQRGVSWYQTKDDFENTPLDYVRKSPVLLKFLTTQFEPAEFVNLIFGNGQCGAFWHFIAANKFDYNSNEFKAGYERVYLPDAELVSATNEFDVKREAGMAPLHIAAIKGSKAAWQFFITKGASTHTKDHFGRTPLDYASQHLHLKSTIIHLTDPLEFVLKKFIVGYTKKYWHSVAVNVWEEETYKKPIVKEMIDLLATKLIDNTGNSFDRKSNGGLTPLHVAAICANRPAWKFLLSKGASIETKDDYGKTPLDYAKMYPEFFESIKPKSHKISTNIEAVLSPIFAAKKVDFPRGKFVYKSNTQDFGLIIKELFLAGNDLQLNKNLKKIAAHLGFEIRYLNSDIHPRDGFYHGNNKLISPFNHHMPLSGPFVINHVIQRAYSREFYHGGSSRTTDTKIREMNFGIKARYYHQIVELMQITKESSSYIFEGGNQFVLTNSQGQKKILMGDQQLYINLNYRNANNVFTSNKIKFVAEDTIMALAEEMYEQGLYEQNGRSGLVEMYSMPALQQKDILSRMALQTCSFAEAYAVKSYNNNNPLQLFQRNKVNVKEISPLVSEYAYKKEDTKKFIAKQHNVDVDHVLFLPPVFHHLNAFLRPGPNGSIFIVDFDLCAGVCQALLENAKHLQLSSNDFNDLKIYMASARSRHIELSNLLKDVKNQLKEAGFHVIPSLGYFSFEESITENNYMMSSRDRPKPRKQCFNIINSFTGWSEKTQKYYMISAGISVGDRLGLLFMDAFALFMKQYFNEDEFELYYVGKDKGINTYSQNMQRFNKYTEFSGIHDLTFEYKTASHDTT